jgi:hypothetical protein
MNLISLLTNLPALILLITNEILRESQRTGKTPEELLADAGVKIDENEQKAIELLNRLGGQ